MRRASTRWSSATRPTRTRRSSCTRPARLKWRRAAEKATTPRSATARARTRPAVRTTAAVRRARAVIGTPTGRSATAGSRATAAAASNPTTTCSAPGTGCAGFAARATASLPSTSNRAKSPGSTSEAHVPTSSSRAATRPCGTVPQPSTDEAHADQQRADPAGEADPSGPRRWGVEPLEPPADAEIGQRQQAAVGVPESQELPPKRVVEDARNAKAEHRLQPHPHAQKHGKAPQGGPQMCVGRHGGSLPPHSPIAIATSSRCDSKDCRSASSCDTTLAPRAARRASTAGMRSATSAMKS